MSYYRAAQPYSDSQYELQGFHDQQHPYQQNRADTYNSVHSSTPVVSQAPVQPLRGGRAGTGRKKWIGIGCVLGLTHI